MGSVCKRNNLQRNVPSLNLIDTETDVQMIIQSIDPPKINILTNTQQPIYYSEEDLDLEVYEYPKKSQDFEVSISSDFKGNSQLGTIKFMKFSDMIQQKRQEAIKEHQRYITMQNQTLKRYSLDRGSLGERDEKKSQRSEQKTSNFQNNSRSSDTNKNNSLNPKLEISLVSNNSKEASLNEGQRVAESSFSFGPHKKNSKFKQ